MKTSRVKLRLSKKTACETKTMIWYFKALFATFLSHNSTDYQSYSLNVNSLLIKKRGHLFSDLLNKDS